MSTSDPDLRLLPPGDIDDGAVDEEAREFAEDMGLVWVDGYGWVDPADVDNVP